MKTPKTIDIKCCARCGQDHKALTVLKFTNPPPNTIAWAFCPTNTQPILIQVDEEANITIAWPGVKMEEFKFRDDAITALTKWISSVTDKYSQSVQVFVSKKESTDAS